MYSELVVLRWSDMVMSVKHLSVVANHTWKAVNVVSFCTWTHSIYSRYIYYQVSGLLGYTMLYIVGMVVQRRKPVLVDCCIQ